MLTTGLFALTNAMLRPSISSLVSKEAEMDQGLALGLNSSFMSLARFVDSLLAGAYKEHGWDVNTGTPTQKTLEEFGLEFTLSQ